MFIVEFFFDEEFVNTTLRFFLITAILNDMEGFRSGVRDVFKSALHFIVVR